MSYHCQLLFPKSSTNIVKIKYICIDIVKRKERKGTVWIHGFRKATERVRNRNSQTKVLDKPTDSPNSFGIEN